MLPQATAIILKMNRLYLFVCFGGFFCFWNLFLSLIVLIRFYTISANICKITTNCKLVSFWVKQSRQNYSYGWLFESVTTWKFPIIGTLKVFVRIWKIHTTIFKSTRNPWPHDIFKSSTWACNDHNPCLCFWVIEHALIFFEVLKKSLLCSDGNGASSIKHHDAMTPCFFKVGNDIS